MPFTLLDDTISPSPCGNFSPHTRLRSERHFRLLRLSSSAEELPSFELGCFSQEEDTVYTALSYVWGSPEPTYTVRLNSRTITVRQNLWAFLIELAKAKNRGWFFIDALCINQDDLDERATQVRLMGDIYRNAQEVRIWIPILGKWWEPRGWKLWRPRYRTYYHDEDYSASKIREYEDLTDDYEAQVARASLMNTFRVSMVYNVYWSRLWIVQEILLAKKLTIQWHSLIFDWAEVTDQYLIPSEAGGAALSRYLYAAGVSTLHTNRRDQDERPDHNTILAIIIIAWVHYAPSYLRDGRLLPLPTALKAFGTQGCSVPHDKIFGISSIAHIRMQPDYKTSVMELLAAMLGDCLLSLGYDRSNTDRIVGANNDLVSQLGETIKVALHIDWFDPVVYLIMSCVARTLAPHAEVSMRFWITYGNGRDNQRRHSSIRHMLAGKTLNEARRETVLRILERAELDGTALTAPVEEGETRDYHGWVSFTESICMDLWQRYHLEKVEGGPKLFDIGDSSSNENAQRRPS